jgi:hypothetical protein
MDELIQNFYDEESVINESLYEWLEGLHNTEHKPQALSVEPP